MSSMEYTKRSQDNWMYSGTNSVIINRLMDYHIYASTQLQPRHNINTIHIITVKIIWLGFNHITITHYYMYKKYAVAFFL